MLSRISILGLSLNVPAVNDVFAFAIRKLRSSFSQKQKCGGAKPTKGVSPTGFCVA